jgi:hypothetical protein
MDAWLLEWEWLMASPVEQLVMVSLRELPARAEEWFLAPPPVVLVGLELDRSGHRFRAPRSEPVLVMAAAG